MLVGNNLDARKYESLLKEKNVWFGFSSSAGKREDGKVKSFSTHKITIGSAIGPCKKKEIIDQVFSETKIQATVMEDMDEWLKTHTAFILPLVNACYACDGNLRKIKKDDAAINKIIDEMRSNYEALQKNGYKIIFPFLCQEQDNG